MVTSLRFVAAFVVSACCGVLPVDSATYYVDFVLGNDASPGTSPSSAWKHSPGDDNASGIPDSIILMPGDTVLFKGGVRYKGSITVNTDGSDVQPITFKGDGWGQEKAIVDGSDPLSAVWTRCVSADECGGNPHYQSIWWTDVSFPPMMNSAFAANLHEDGDFLYVAQWPSPDDPFYYDNVENYATAIDRTLSTITSSELASLGGSGLIGAYVLIHEGNNAVRNHIISDYRSNTITYNQTETTLTNYRSFSLANYEALIDAPGEYVFRETPESNGKYRIFLWPRSGDPGDSEISVSVRDHCFHLSNRRHINLEGFVCQYTGGIGTTYQGVAIRAVNGGDNIAVRRNVIQHCRYADKGGYGAIYFSGVNHGLIEDNLAQWNPKHRGIFCAGCQNTVLRGNTVSRAGMTGISFYTCSLSQVVDNSVYDCRGCHANGMSFYLGCDTILIARNRIVDCNFNITIQYWKDVTVYGNYFNGHNNTGSIMVVRYPESSSGTMLVLNNTYVGSSNDYSLSMSLAPHLNVIAINNIIEGGMPNSGVDRSNNLYTGVAWNQQPRYDWSSEPSEIIHFDGSEYHPVDDTLVYLNPSVGGDHRLSETSLAKNAGINVTDLFPTEDFPDFDFSLDIPGNIRGADGVWDIGAYEYVSGGNQPPVLTPIGPQSTPAGQQLQFQINATDPDSDPLTFSATGG